MTSHILPPLHRELRGFLPDAIPHVTRNTTEIMEIFNNCLHNPRLVYTQTRINPQALQRAKRYYIAREAISNASDEPDYSIGSERHQHLTFLSHCAQSINPDVQGALTDSHLITYLQANQIRPII